jgi:hypothetical protein
VARIRFFGFDPSQEGLCHGEMLQHSRDRCLAIEERSGRSPLPGRRDISHRCDISRPVCLEAATHPCGFRRWVWLVVIVALLSSRRTDRHLVVGEAIVLDMA